MEKSCSTLDLHGMWNSEQFQLNECFLLMVSAWLPCGFLWIFLPLELYLTFQSANRCIPWNWFNVSKLVGYAALVLICLMNLILLWLTSAPVAVWVTNILQKLTYVVGILVTLVHKKYGIRTSAIVFVFWLLMILSGAVRYVHEVFGKMNQEQPRYEYLITAVYYPLIIFMFLLHSVADSAPLFSLYPLPKKPLPENSVSCWWSYCLLWFDKLALSAHKKRLETSDLWDMNYENSVRGLTDRFEDVWNKERRKLSNYNKDKVSSPFTGNCYQNGTPRSKLVGSVGYEKVTEKPADISLTRVLWKMFGSRYMAITIFKVVSEALGLCSPFILRYLVNFTENEEPFWHGYVYCGLMFLANFIQSGCMNWYVYRMFNLGLEVRTVLMSVVYRKALRISNDARRLFTIGEITNLMAVDAQRFYDTVMCFTYIISSFLQLIIILSFLYGILGWPSVAGCFVLLLAIPLCMVAASKTRLYETEQMKQKDKRVNITSEVLSGIKSLKVYAWEESFEKKISEIRDKEITLLRYSAYLNTGVSFIWGATPFMICLITFALYVMSDENNILNADVAFVSLALLNTLRLQLSFVPKNITNAIQMMVACKRIRTFLNSEELDTTVVSHNASEKNALVIEHGTFSWGKSNNDNMSGSTLTDICMKVPEKSLAAVIGTVGAGKSSLLAALLGEMYKITGYVNVKGRVAYVPQQAWIQNATVKENILFGSRYKGDFYNEVIRACALDVDLKILPGGDETEIGEKGVNLSGGQKQRISLARAVYNNADVYLLDDPLSAVDVHVGKHIFEKVIGPRGILCEKTRILVTHATSYLPDVDLIVMMKNGTVYEVDTYETLLTKNQYFSEFLSSVQTRPTDENYQNNDGTEINKMTISEKEDHQKKEECGIEEPEHGQGKLTSEEVVEQGKVKWSVYLQYLKQGGLGYWLVCVIWHVLYNGLLVGSNFWLSQWSMDSLAASTAPGTMERRLHYIGTYLLFGSGQFISVFLGSLMLYIATLKASEYFHFSILRRVLRWPCYMFDVTPIGRIVNRLSYDTDVTDNILPSALSQLFSTLGSFLATLFVIAYTVPVFIAALVPIVAFCYLLKEVFVTLTRQLRRLESTTRSPVFSHFSETIAGASVIRAYGMVEKFIEQFELKANLYQAVSEPIRMTMRWCGIRMDIASTFVIIGTAFIIVTQRGTISSGTAGLVLCYTFLITYCVVRFVKYSTELETNIISVERLKQYDETPQENIKGATSSPLIQWPEKGEIEFQNFSVRYREGTDLVLKNINLKIKCGQKVGIVGRTGAGKSSLTLSLFRIIEPAGGCILIDNVDISTLDLYTLRLKITIIPQDPVLFSGSLRFNLDPFEEYTDEAIHRALEVAHWKDSVTSVPNGLYYEVSEYGQNLSVGQRQLLCLARAILRKTKILILDEATAAVDVEMDNLIQQTIRSEFSDCTVLTIAHRLNTIMDSDRVMILEKGEVVDFDSPEALMKRESGLFYIMVKGAGLAV